MPTEGCRGAIYFALYTRCLMKCPQVGLAITLIHIHQFLQVSKSEAVEKVIPAADF